MYWGLLWWCLVLSSFFSDLWVAGLQTADEQGIHDPRSPLESHLLREGGLNRQDGDEKKPAFLIVVLAKDRPEALRRLLTSIGQAHYGSDKVHLEIHIDFDEGEGHRDTIKIATDFTFQTKPHVNIHRHRLGLRAAWLGAWINPKPAHHAIILEDDIELSPHWYTWLKAAWRAYDTDYLAGISLSRQTLVAKKPAEHRDVVDHAEPFLYKLVGSIAFSPHPLRWKEFLEWVATVDMDTFDADVPGLVTSNWYRNLDKKSMWTQLFIYFCEQRDLYTLYSYHENRETMASHWRSQGEHYEKELGPDFNLVQNLPNIENFALDKVQRLGWDALVESGPHSNRRYAGSESGGWSFYFKHGDRLDTIYSLGASEDLTWENYMIQNYGSTVWLVEPSTPPQLKIDEGNKRFHHILRSFPAQADERLPKRDLENLMRQNGHEFVHIDILKIDMKFDSNLMAEMRGWFESQWLSFDQLLISFHDEIELCENPVPEEVGHCHEFKLFQHAVLNGLYSNGYTLTRDRFGDGKEMSFRKTGVAQPRFEDVTKITKEIQAAHGVVNIQLLNEGFVEMTRNWICNVKTMPQVLEKTVFITTDTAAYDGLKAFDPSLNIVLHRYSANKELAYGDVAYFYYMLFRTRLIQSFLENDITIWLTESDATWIRDPTELVLRTPGDIIGMSDQKFPKKAMNGGFILFHPTSRTKALWLKLLEKLEETLKSYDKTREEYIGELGSEQIMLSHFLKSEEITVSYMDGTKFVAGVWYSDEGSPFYPPYRSYVEDPVVILNNWVIGNSPKVARAKQFGHWFLNDDQSMCARGVESNIYPPVYIGYLIWRAVAAVLTLYLVYEVYKMKQSVAKRNARLHRGT